MQQAQITQVTSFQFDGKNYDTRALAEAAQAKDQLHQLMTKCGVGAGGEWSAKMFHSFMIENAHEIAQLLDKVSITTNR